MDGMSEGDGLKGMGWKVANRFFLKGMVRDGVARFATRWNVGRGSRVRRLGNICNS